MLHSQTTAAQWADWLIYGVRYDARHTHIELLFSRVDLGTIISDKSQSFTRQAVIDAIERGTKFCTIFMQNGRWTRARWCMSLSSTA